MFPRATAADLTGRRTSRLSESSIRGDSTSAARRLPNEQARSGNRGVRGPNNRRARRSGRRTSASSPAPVVERYRVRPGYVWAPGNWRWYGGR